MPPLPPLPLLADLPRLPDLPLAQRLSVELPSIVYFLLRDDRVVYVGQSQFFFWRLTDHLGARDRRPFDAVAFIPVPLADLSAVESAFIRHLRLPQVVSCADASRDAELLARYMR